MPVKPNCSMRIRSLLFASAVAATLAACNSKDKPVEEQKPAVLSSKNVQGISAASKVWHGERLQGSAPAPKGSTIQLDAQNTEPVTRAFAGRYAIIQPAIDRGDVAGYYLQFNGAK